MADNNGGGGAMGILGVIVGALIVVALGFFLLNGQMGGETKKITVDIKPPAAAAPK